MENLNQQKDVLTIFFLHLSLQCFLKFVLQQKSSCVSERKRYKQNFQFFATKTLTKHF